MIRRATAVVAVLLASAAFGIAPGARAQEAGPRPDQVAWWFELQQLPGLTIPPLVAVPEGGLLVQHVLELESPSLLDLIPEGFLSGTTAYGAVRYAVTPGSSGTLRLDVPFGSTALAAQLRACRAITAWNPDPPPGPWFSRPSYGEPCLPGDVADDGASVTFAVPATSTRDGVLDLVVVPAEGALPFLVIFGPPADDALDLQDPPPGEPLPAIVPPVEGAPQPAPMAPIDVPMPDLGPAGVPSPAPVVRPVPLAPLATAEPVRGSAAAAVALGLLAAGWLVSTRRRTRPPRSLLALRAQ